MLTALDDAIHGEVLDDVVFGHLKGGFEGVARACAESQRVAVAVEVAVEGIILVAATGSCRDVCIKAGADIVLPLGIDDVLAEGVPVGLGADGKIVGGGHRHTP